MPDPTPLPHPLLKGEYPSSLVLVGGLSWIIQPLRRSSNALVIVVFGVPSIYPSTSTSSLFFCFLFLVLLSLIFLSSSVRNWSEE